MTEEITYYDDDKTVLTKSIMIDDKMKLTTSYRKTGEKFVESYTYQGIDEDVYHREDGPARICYDRSGNVRLKEWFIHNKRHRWDGPATEELINGKLINCIWLINNKELQYKDIPDTKEYPISIDQQVKLKLLYG